MNTAAAQKHSEPSMEEILASIRRIISDDADAGLSTPVARTLAPAPEPVAAPAPTVRPDGGDAGDAAALRAQIEQEVFELGDPLGDDMGLDDLEFRPMAAPIPHKEAPAAFQPAVTYTPQPQAEAAPQRPLLASSTDEVVSRAFNSLAHTVLSENSRTLEDLVREMLRPLLKNWLDDNLPSLVERLVRAEIERVARGGR